MEKRYIDGFSQMHFAAGMVRIDAFVLAPNPGGEPVQEQELELVMAPQAFADALNNMQALASRLVQAGVLQNAPRQ